MDGAIGLVSGSGLELESVLDRVDREAAFEDVPGLAAGCVAGHDYRFVLGACGGAPVVLQRGRRHVYEGAGLDMIWRTVDALHAFGVRRVLFTNVSGGLRADLGPGTLVAVDAVKLWPCVCWPERPGALQPDFVPAGCDAQGAYFWMHGPCYETRAEVAALQRLGGSVVGMSTAPELQRCRELGIEAGVISCVTNACGAQEKLTHAHVVAAARRANDRLVALLRRDVQALAGC